MRVLQTLLSVPLRAACFSLVEEQAAMSVSLSLALQRTNQSDNEVVFAVAGGFSALVQACAAQC